MGREKLPAASKAEPGAARGVVEVRKPFPSIPRRLGSTQAATAASGALGRDRRASSLNPRSSLRADPMDLGSGMVFDGSDAAPASSRPSLTDSGMPPYNGMIDRGLRPGGAR